MPFTPTAVRVSALRLLQLVILLAASGCAVSADHPLALPEDSELIPEYLLSAWDFVEIAGLNAEDKDGGVILERNADGSLKILVTETALTVERRASLVTVSDRIILSIVPHEGEEAWGFVSLAFDEGSQKLTLSLLGHLNVVRDIRLGLVAGEVYQFDQQELAHLSASSEQLRAYFAAHGEAFSDRIAVLRKRPS